MDCLACKKEIDKTIGELEVCSVACMIFYLRKIRTPKVVTIIEQTPNGCKVEDEYGQKYSLEWWQVDGPVEVALRKSKLSNKTFLLVKQVGKMFRVWRLKEISPQKNQTFQGS